MSQERRPRAPEILKMIDVVAKESLEQVKTYSPSLLLTTCTSLGDSMLRHAIANRKNPDVFIYLYNEVFKPASPDVRDDSPFPIIIRAANRKNAPILHFLAAKGADLRPVVIDRDRTEEHTVFGFLKYKGHELLYEQLLAIEAKRKPALHEVYAHNMWLVGKSQDIEPSTSTRILDYIGNFWSKSKEVKELTPRDIMEILMTKSLAEVRKIPANVLRDFRSEEKDTPFSGVSALHFALKNIVHAEVFNHLYEKVIEMDSPNRLVINGVSLLVYAASFNNQRAITFLVERGANLHDKDPYGKTALQIIEACDPEFAKSLALIPIAKDTSAIPVPYTRSPASNTVRRRNFPNDYGQIISEDDLQTPLLEKISPPGSLSQ
jgi:ankyrin repeat protein